MTERVGSLADALAPGEIPWDEREAWRIDHDNQATWALRKLWSLEREQERIDQAAKAEVERIKDWRERATKALVGDVAFFKSKLSDYHRRLRRDGKAGKTYKLPAGDLVARTPRGAVEVDNETEFVEWAIANDRHDLLNVKAAKSALHRLINKDGMLVTEDGEIVPGVHIEGVVEGQKDDPDLDNYDVKVADIGSTVRQEESGKDDPEDRQP